MNIVTLAASFLTPAVVARIATALGINPSLAQMAVSAALPAILAGLAGKAAQPAGLGVLTGLLGQQNPATLSEFGASIGGDHQASLIEAGTGALNTVFGASTTGLLAGALGKFTGVPEATSASLLGMLAPVALGTLAQQQTAAGLDAAGLASLLAGQKDHIAAALPAGFGDVLKATGLLDGALPAAPSIAAPAAVAAVAAMTSAAAAPARPMAAHTPAAPAKPAPSSLMRYLPLLAAAVLALAIYGLWQSSRGPALPAGTKIVYNNVDVGAKATGLYETIKSTLGGIKDEASATAALPKLKDAVGSLNELGDIKGKLPADGRQALATLFATLLPGLEGLVASAGKVPGGDALKPILEQVLERMKALAKA